MSFSIDPRLERDSIFIKRIGFNQVRLALDARFPWLIVVPEIHNIKELIELSDEQQQEVLRTSNMVSRALLKVFSPDKLNVAAIGNVVEQLHIHHVARFINDAAWPAPIWGNGTPQEYTSKELSYRIKQIVEQLV